MRGFTLEFRGGSAIPPGECWMLKGWIPHFTCSRDRPPGPASPLAAADPKHSDVAPKGPDRVTNSGNPAFPDYPFPDYPKSDYPKSDYRMSDYLGPDYRKLD